MNICIFFQVQDLELKPLLSAKEVSMVIHGTYYNSWEKIKNTVSSLLNYCVFASKQFYVLSITENKWSNSI